MFSWVSSGTIGSNLFSWELMGGDDVGRKGYEESGGI